MDYEILFRGKTETTEDCESEWIFGDLLSNAYPTPNIRPINYASCYPVIRSTIGRYTGLTDKNGKKIFEGDILDLSAIMITDFGVVKFGEYKDNDMDDDIFCGHVGFYVDIKEMHYNYVRKDILFFVSRCKIIGNIHDNSELLKEDKLK